jgi:hypothetical protein
VVCICWFSIASSRHFAPTYNDGNVYSASDRGVWREFESEKMHRTLRDMGIAFFDFSRRSVHADPGLFMDAVHPGEPLTLECAIDIRKDSSVRKALPELEVTLPRLIYFARNVAFAA